MLKEGKLRILFVDQATALGGSVVVIARLVRAIDTTTYECLVAGEMDESILRDHFKSAARLHVIKHVLNYTHRERFSEWVRKLPYSKWLPKTAIYVFTLVAALVNLLYIWRLAALIVREKVDLVHLNNNLENVEATLAACLTARPYVVHAHGSGHLTFSQRLFIRPARKFVAISDYIHRDLTERGVLAENIVTIPNPVEVMEVDPESVLSLRARYGVVKSQKVFGLFGRIVPWKGHREFVLAASLVLRQQPDAVAFIVGSISDGGEPFLVELHDLVKREGMQDRVIFTGHIQQVSELYGIMDLVVHTSIEPEPFGLVITEAMACGVPVVASPFGAPPEIVDDGQDGLIVDPRDTSCLANAILSLFRDDDRRRSMGERARRKVLAQYDAGVYARRMEQVYREAL